MKVVLVGNESAGVQTLRLLERAGHEIAGVLAPTSPVRGGVTLWQVASATGYPTWPARRVCAADFAEERGFFGET